MPITAEQLPTELHYIIPMADRHGSEAPVAHFNRNLGRHVAYAETLSPKSLVSLRGLYEEIRSKQHSRLINDWCDDDTGPEKAETKWAVYGLLCLFAQLAKLGIAPFNDGKVGPMERSKSEVLNWNKLPEELRYLAAPAEKYGKLQFDDPIYEFLQQRMTPEERAELKELQERWRHEGEAIEHWLDEYNMTKHAEAGLVYFTGYLLATAADLELL